MNQTRMTVVKNIHIVNSSVTLLISRTTSKLLTGFQTVSGHFPPGTFPPDE